MKHIYYGNNIKCRLSYILDFVYVTVTQVLKTFSLGNCTPQYKSQYTEKILIKSQYLQNYYKFHCSSQFQSNVVIYLIFTGTQIIHIP